MKKKLVWSGLIKSLLATYLKNFVAFYLAILLLQSSNKVDGIVVTSVIFTGLPLVTFPLWNFVFLYRNRNDLEKPEIQEKYSGLYSNLNQNFNLHTVSTLFYPTLFVLRRLLFVIIAMI